MDFHTGYFSWCQPFGAVTAPHYSRGLGSLKKFNQIQIRYINNAFHAYCLLDGPSNCAGYVRFATSEIKEKGSKMLSKVPSEENLCTGCHDMGLKSTISQSGDPFNGQTNCYLKIYIYIFFYKLLYITINITIMVHLLTIFKKLNI